MSLKKYIEGIHEDIKQNSFDNTIMHKNYTYYTYDIIVIFRGVDSKNENVENYNVLVIDLMDGKVCRKYSHSVFCLKGFFGNKTLIFNKDYDVKFTGLTSYSFQEEILDQMVRYKQDGIKISKHDGDMESEKDVHYNKVIVKEGKCAFAIIMQSTVMSSAIRTQNSIPSVYFVGYMNGSTFRINKNNVFKIFKNNTNKDIIKVKNNILLLFKNMKKITSGDKLALKMFFGKENERIVNPIYHNDEITIQLRNPLGINYGRQRHLNATYHGYDWSSNNEEFCYIMEVTNKTEENMYIAKKIFENIFFNQEYIKNFTEDKFKKICVGEDCVFISKKDITDICVFVKTDLGTISFINPADMKAEANKSKACKRALDLVNMVDKKIITIAKLSGQSKQTVVNELI